MELSGKLQNICHTNHFFLMHLLLSIFNYISIAIKNLILNFNLRKNILYSFTTYSYNVIQYKTQSRQTSSLCYKSIFCTLNRSLRITLYLPCSDGDAELRRHWLT